MAETTNVLVETAIQVLEQQALLVAEPCPGDDPEIPPGDSLQASISFAGPVDGSLELLIPAAMGRELATNLLGISPGDGPLAQATQTALKKMLQITCQRVLVGLYGTGQMFQTTPPSVHVVPATKCEELRRGPYCAAILVERAHCAVMCLQLRGLPGT